ncbi:hypothetical protein SGUI_2716 [Serinicoccus hydrothermalis]|uniref:Uncharacterized protein n=1 Tax=Serinicoccus hydrothermalis TaxID=1758689 RepID=A0A1B1NF95_9MICO|nr:PH domain-containing protein [Serinicoccus hydrothermalis]ANS80112.1 hypothetical protein SGUI_2716 [Serinicoccus hydrothermalis]
MTWTRHRPKALSWVLLLAFVLVIGFTIARYVGGEVAVQNDVLGLVLRLAVLVVVVLAYLRTGGSTTASKDGLVVHNGLRATEVPAALVRNIDEDARRGGAVAMLTTGEAVELPGVPATDVRQVRRALKGR